MYWKVFWETVRRQGEWVRWKLNCSTTSQITPGIHWTPQLAIHPEHNSFSGSVIHEPQHVSKALTLPGLEVEFRLWFNGQSMALTLPAWKGLVPKTSTPRCWTALWSKAFHQMAHINLLFCINQLIHTNRLFFSARLFSCSFCSLLAVTEATSALCGRWWLLFVSRWPDVCDQRRSPQTKLLLSGRVLLCWLISWRICAGSLGYEYAKQKELLNNSITKIMLFPPSLRPAAVTLCVCVCAVIELLIVSLCVTHIYVCTPTRISYPLSLPLSLHWHSQCV